ncbi:MAG: bifunctional 3'-5' exonuclease/DNA polymerase, partial [Aquificaceae bacterium]|nr:bifunctional 3'-5' exonuclease/DNA polymerase [Aquificaceae bacterium]
NSGIVGHNLKFDLKFLLEENIEPLATYDTMIAHQLLGGEEHVKRASLREVAREHLGKIVDKSLQLSDWSAKNLTKEQLEYAANDVILVRELFPLLNSKLNESSSNKVELPEIPEVEIFGIKNPVVAVEMSFVKDITLLEMGGMPINEEGLEKLNQEIGKSLNKKVMNFISLYRVDPFSPKQLSDLFTKKLKLDLPKTEKGNISTDDKALAQYIHIPAIESLLEIRSSKKTIEKLQEIKTNAKNGRIYPEFKQIGAITGRMSSYNPNVQNISRDLRYIFHANDGQMLVIADFSQIELRIACEYVGEEKMLKALKEGIDLHKYTASILLSKPISEITKQERQLAKAVNFGLIYGISAKGLVEYARTYGVKLSQTQAQSLRDGFFAHYSAIRDWHESVKAKLKEHGSIKGQTLLGRSYIAQTFPDAVNYPIQGTGADLLKLSVVLFRKKNLPLARVINLIHDEIVVECPEDSAKEVSQSLKEAMLDAGSRILKSVPVEVELLVSKSWKKD